MSLNTGWEEIITLQYLHIWKQCTRVANFLVGARLSPFYGLPGGPVDKNSPANAGLERSRVPEGKQARVPQLLRPAPHGARALRQEQPPGRERVAPTRCN